MWCVVDGMKESEEGAARQLLAAQTSAACGSRTRRCRRLVLVDGAEMEPCIVSRDFDDRVELGPAWAALNFLRFPRRKKKNHACQFCEVREHGTMILFAVINQVLALWLRGKRVDQPA